MKLDFTCGHCHQDGEAGARVWIKPDDISTPACGRCGAPLFNLDIEILPRGTLRQYIDALEAANIAMRKRPITMEVENDLETN